VGQDAAGAAGVFDSDFDDAELEPESPPDELLDSDFFSPPELDEPEPEPEDELEPARESVR
jgi:hypothetical protein